MAEVWPTLREAADADEEDEDEEEEEDDDAAAARDCLLSVGPMYALPLSSISPHTKESSSSSSVSSSSSSLSSSESEEVVRRRRRRPPLREVCRLFPTLRAFRTFVPRDLDAPVEEAELPP